MPRPTVRLRMTLLYAGVFVLASAALLTVSYILVRNNVTADHVSVGSGPADELRRAIQREVADDALHRLRIQYAIALAAMTLLSVLLGWLVAGRVLRPLQQITATARRVSQDTLDERIALEGPRDELKELADTFDAMLERLSGAFASQRRFVANASHELRTPLTVMRTELEVTLADPDASNAELRTMAEEVHDAMNRTERLVQSLLTLARSEGAVTRRDPLDLASAARLALEPRRRATRTPPAWRSPPTCTPRRCRAIGACSRAWWPTSSRTPSATTARAGACRSPPPAATGAASSRSSTTATCSTPTCCRACSSPSSASTAARAATAPGSGSRSCARSPRPTAAPSRSPCAPTAACAPP